MCQLVERVCECEDLSTYDPYDVWKSSYGLRIKKLFNHSRLAGVAPAALLTLFDIYVNNRLRLSYTRQEYPVVRAFAALSLMNLYRIEPKEKRLQFAKSHLDWLVANRSKNCAGYGWGLGFEHAAKSAVVYDKDTPFVTITPYPLEAFLTYHSISGDDRYADAIRRVLVFLDQDVKILEDTKHHLVTSYGTSKDRIVVNAVAYTMYMYTLLRTYVDSDRRRDLDDKIRRLYQFVKDQQRPDGSWLYSPEGSSFIDCFHSCIVLKNIIKVNRLFELDGAELVVGKGYKYLRENFLDERHRLFRRFSLKNKPSLVKFDLYDNAEMLNLANLVGDKELVRDLSQAIERVFLHNKDIYSQVDIFNRRYNKNMLRWAVMPYLCALSSVPKATGLSK